jgi:hypothetical protein
MPDSTTARSAAAPVNVSAPQLVLCSFQLLVTFDPVCKRLHPTLPHKQSWKAKLELANSAEFMCTKVDVSQGEQHWFCVGKGDSADCTKNGITCRIQEFDGSMIHLELHNQNTETAAITFRICATMISNSNEEILAVVDPQIVLPPDK